MRKLISPALGAKMKDVIHPFGTLLCVEINGAFCLVSTKVNVREGSDQTTVVSLVEYRNGETQINFHDSTLFCHGSSFDKSCIESNDGKTKIRPATDEDIKTILDTWNPNVPYTLEAFMKKLANVRHLAAGEFQRFEQLSKRHLLTLIRA
jgi:hypothetical protein